MDTLKIEIDNLKSKLLCDQTQPSVSKLGRTSTLVLVNIRKSLLLRVIIDGNESIESAKLYAAEAINLKPERAKSISEFLKRANTMLKPDDSQLNGYQLSGMYEKCSLMLVGEDYLRESLDVIESRSKSCKFEFDEDERRDTQASSRLDNKKQRRGKKIDNDDDNCEEESKKKFKGSEFIFQRIKWDENIDKGQVVIGYLDRFLGIKDIRFEDFKGVHEDKEGVPFHRIRYFKINGRVVWDREQKIDLLTGSGESVAGFFNSATTRLDQLVIDDENEDVFIDGDVLVYSDNNWNDANLEANRSILGDDFKILSYNLMSKVNFKKSIQSKMNFKKSQAEVINNRQSGDEDEYGLKPLEKIDRMRRALESIRENSWDFLVLQECDVHEETRLQEDEFVRKTYFICSLNRDLIKLEHPNCVILSKTRPTMFKLLPLTQKSNKYALIAKFDSQHGRILLVNIHLSSNKAKNFMEKRQTQLETLKRYLIDQADEFDLLTEHSFLCGDFNFGDSVDNEAECTLINELFEKNGFSDLVQGAFTFDPARNFSAAVTAFNQQPRRLDRVLYKPANNNKSLELTSTYLVNTAPFRITDSELTRPVLYQPFLDIREFTQQNRIKINDPKSQQKLEITYDQLVGNDEIWLHISDHYGIECQFRSKTNESSRLIDKKDDDELKLVHKSALAIIAPKHAAEFIQKVRNIHDPQFNRWPPHINLLYPFFEDISLDTSQDADSTQISQIFTCLSRFKPFRCDLDKLSTFDNNGIVFLEPSKESAQQMRKIYDDLVGLFTSNKSKHVKWKKGGLTPHMTIAQPVDKRRVDKKWSRETMNTISSNFSPTSSRIASFEVDCVYWIRRNETSPFHIEQAFPLGPRYPSIRTGLLLSDFNNNDGILKFMNDKLMIPTDNDEKKLEKTCNEIVESIMASLRSTVDAENVKYTSNSQVRFELKHDTDFYALVTCGSFMHGINCRDLDLALVIHRENSNSDNSDKFTADFTYQLAQNDTLFHIVRDIPNANNHIIELCLKSNKVCEVADVQIHSVNFKCSIGESLFFENFKLMKKIESEHLDDYKKFASISGLFENQNIKKHIANYKDFQIVTSFVKHWAKCRCIYGKAFGYLGGISWSILVAYYLKSKPMKHELELDNSNVRFVSLVKGFFEFYAKFDWANTPVSLIDVSFVANETGRYQHTSPIMIHQSVYPYHNTSRNVNEKSRRLIRIELTRASELFREESASNIYQKLESVCKQIETCDLTDKKIGFRIEFNERNDLNHIFVLIKAKAQGLVTNLLRLNSKADFRPFTHLFESNNYLAGKWSHCVWFYIIIVKNDETNFNSSEKQLLVDYCQSFINTIRSLSHCSDYEITFEYQQE